MKTSIISILALLSIAAGSSIISFPAAGDELAAGIDMLDAITEGDHQKLRSLLDAGVPADAPAIMSYSIGMTPLMLTANIDDTVAAKILIDAGADPFIRDDAGRTAAWHAAFAENFEIFQMLMSVSGVSSIIDLPDTTTGNTMLHVGVMSFEPQTVELLLSMGADRNVRNGFGQTPSDLCKVAQTPGCSALK